MGDGIIGAVAGKDCCVMDYINNGRSLNFFLTIGYDKIYRNIFSIKVFCRNEFNDFDIAFIISAEVDAAKFFIDRDIDDRQGIPINIRTISQ